MGEALLLANLPAPIICINTFRNLQPRPFQLSISPSNHSRLAIMLSIRTIARSAPRAMSRLTTTTLRQQPIARPSMLKSIRPATASFSTTVGRWKAAKQGETDEELSAKLDSEIQIEEEMKEQEQEPASVKDFLANTPFELIDTPGQEVVKLQRNFGDEKITVSFSIADISNYDPYANDPAMEDDESFDEDATPISLTITIEKPGKTAGVMTIDATAANGGIVVDNMHYFDDADVAKVESPEAAHKRAEVHPGPPFGTLDDDLQVLVERYLEERGISQTLAVFVPDYVDVKEQKEYLRWLSNVKGFVDA